jgi:hypothetical protein
MGDNLDFLKHFLTYGGWAKVLDFLQEILREEEIEEEENKTAASYNAQHHGGEFQYRIAVESVRIAASVIAGVCRNKAVKQRKRQSNRQRPHYKNHAASAAAAVQHFAGVTATVVVNHDGIETLLLASDLCCRCFDKKDSSAFDFEASLEALEKI